MMQIFAEIYQHSCEQSSLTKKKKALFKAQPKAYHTLLEFPSEPVEIHSVGGHSMLCTTMELNNPQLVTVGERCTPEVSF